MDVAERKIVPSLNKGSGIIGEINDIIYIYTYMNKMILGLTNRKLVPYQTQENNSAIALFGTLQRVK